MLLCAYIHVCNHHVSNSVCAHYHVALSFACFSFAYFSCACVRLCHQVALAGLAHARPSSCLCFSAFCFGFLSLCLFSFFLPLFLRSFFSPVSSSLFLFLSLSLPSLSVSLFPFRLPLLCLFLPSRFLIFFCLFSFSSLLLFTFFLCEGLYVQD